MMEIMLVKHLVKMVVVMLSRIPHLMTVWLQMCPAGAHVQPHRWWRFERGGPATLDGDDDAA